LEVIFEVAWYAGPVAAWDEDEAFLEGIEADKAFKFL